MGLLHNFLQSYIHILLAYAFGIQPVRHKHPLKIFIEVNEGKDKMIFFKCFLSKVVNNWRHKFLESSFYISLIAQTDATIWRSGNLSKSKTKKS